MLAMQVRKTIAEKVKHWLRQKGLLAPHINALRSKEYVFFPVLKKTKTPFESRLVEKHFKLTPHTRPFREVLKEILPEKTGQEAVAAYDTLGDIAIVEIPTSLSKKKRAIARALLESNARLKTVLCKASAMQGPFRVRKLIWLAGKQKFIAEYRESGCVLRFDVRKTYFSPRLSFERLRIANLVKADENVLALFAGVGPYPIVIAKKQPRSHIKAIELNPDAYAFLKENITRNHVKNVEAISGDVREILTEYSNWADRVIMPLPHTGETFLESVIDATRDNGIIHFYGFGGKKEGIFTKAHKAIENACHKKNVRFRILRQRTVRPYAPYVFQVVVDFQIRKKK